MTPADVDALADDAAALAHRWLSATTSGETSRERRTTRRLAALVADPAGLELAVRFVDRVARPEDRRVAARELGGLRGGAHFLGPADRALLALGARVAPLVPALAVPAARVRLRQLVGHLVGDASGRRFTKHLAASREAGFGVNVNLLGEAVLGEDEAQRRLSRLDALVRRPGVDYVSVKASAVVSQISVWDHAGSVDRLVARLLPLYELAAQKGVFLNLDMEEYKDLSLTVDVFTALLERVDVHAGIVLQAYLPDSVAALESLLALNRSMKVRLVKGANLAMEKVEAELHGWAQAPYETKQEVDANYVRLLDRALRPGPVRVGVASHNLFHVALAHLLARHRGVSDQLDVEMLQGMAPAQARAVQADVGRVVLYTPVVARADFDVAVSYLVRRLEENAAEQNFLHALFAGGPSALAAQEEAFRASVRDRALFSTVPRRLPAATSGSSASRPSTVERTIEEGAASQHASSGAPASRPPTVGRTIPFRNAADSDPALETTRAWAPVALAADPGPLTTPVVTAVEQVDAAVDRALSSGWADVSPAERTRLLRAAGDALEAARGALVSVMAHEAGKTVAEADPEVSEAVDFARYYAPPTGAGATFTPARLTVVAPPWNFPVAIPMGGVLAALAAGSPVLLKPAPQTPRCVEVAVEALHAAGIPHDAVQVVRAGDDETGRRLITHPAVERVILTGSIETAELFLQWRPDLQLIAETSGKNALVITPSADLDLAVADLVRSAFGHAGQKCSAASLAILVGSVATSDRFRRQLVDAVRSLHVGWPTDLGAAVGPLVEQPGDKLLRALTQPDPGESWLVEPRQVDGSLWSPGVREGVAPGSWFHRTEAFGPVLGIMTATDLDEAIDLQNATAFGLTGGLHSLDEDEVGHWLERVEVGNAYVNRGTTGAVVRRQPFGGWKASTVGPGAKAGGPHYVAQLGTWTDDVTGDWLAWARADDERAWAEVFSKEHDPSGLVAESNVLRYRPIDVLTVRVAEGAVAEHVERVLHAARTAGVRTRLDSGPDFPERVRSGLVSGRIRVVGTEPGLRDAAAARVGAVTVLDAPVVASAERELLTVVREQAVSRTRHRYGHVSGG